MAGVFDFLFKKKTNGEDDLKAVLSPEEAKKENFLSQFLPDEPEKQQSLAQALLLGGASMMANGGPSEKPTNLLSIVGSGLGNGVGAYNANMDGIADRNTKGMANRVNQVKLQNAQNAQSRASAFIEKYGQPSENGYSIEALFALHEMQLANGDEESARATQKMIQELQQTAAGNGMVLGENGYQLADGYGKSLYDTKKAESLGSAVGQNAQITADQKDFQFGKDNPEFRKYETEKKKDTSITVNTGPKDGDMWKALNEEREKASGAQGALNQVYEMKHSLANATTGFGANQILWGQKVIAAMGGDSSKVTKLVKTWA